MNRTRVAVLFGGRSIEHEISVITGLQLLDALDVVRFEPVPVYISQEGEWYTGDAVRSKDFFSKLPESLQEMTKVTLLPKPGVGGLTILEAKQSLFKKNVSEIVPVDVFVPAFHGQFGEDGCIQGLLELADVPYTGCGPLASSVSMDKYVCKKYLEAHGVPSLTSALVRKPSPGEPLGTLRDEIRSLDGLKKFPLFVKPNHLGSSIGVSKADSEAELDAALVEVFRHDTEAIVEPCVVNLMEVNVSIIDGESQNTSVVEIPVASDELLSYEDKYLRAGKGKKGGAGDGGMANLPRVIDPPDLDEQIKSQVCQFAEQSFDLLGCSGVVRFDFIIDNDTGSIYFNELNPIPGSFSFYLWEKSHPPLLYTELITRIIERALVIAEQKSSLHRDFGFRALTAFSGNS